MATSTSNPKKFTQSSRLKKPAYGLIGSRDACPEHILLAEEIGEFLAKEGFRAASGNALGMDQAYARGVNRVRPELMKLCLPWRSYEAAAIHPLNKIEVEYTEDMARLAEQHHPAWPRLTRGVRSLMIRNAVIISTTNLTVACLNPNRKGGGGTGHGVKISEALSHPVFLIEAGTMLDTFKDWHHEHTRVQND